LNISLLKSIRIISKLDSSQSRLAVFEEIRKKSFIITAVLFFYERLQKTWIATLMVGLYGLKSYFSLFFLEQSANELISIENFPNEKKQILFVKKNLESIKVTRIQACLKFDVKSFSKVLKYGFNTKDFLRYLKIIHNLSKRLHFMPLCRVASNICFYSRFKKELSESSYKAILVASNYSPDALGLRWSAYSLKIPSIFISHAAVPRISQIPSLNSELNIIDGPSSLETYKQKGKCFGKVIFKGIDGVESSMRLDAVKNENMVITFFLSALVDLNILKKNIEQALSFFKLKKIIIRPHPVQLVNPNLNELLKKFSKIELSINNSIESDIKKSDLAFIATSSCALETLKGGLPSVYIKDLDHLSPNYYNFVDKKILFSVSEISELNLDALKLFYSEDWPKRFQHFDPYYKNSENKFKQILNTEVNKLIHESVIS